MVKKHSSIDGFVPRRASRFMGNRELPSPIVNNKRGSTEHSGLSRLSGDDLKKTEATVLTPGDGGLLRADIDASLSGIDQTEPTPRKKMRRLDPVKRKKMIKRAVIVLLVLLIGLGIWFVARVIIANNHMFKGDLFGIIQSKPLKQDENGRSNFLILGTSEDDPGHEAAWLTDSIMIVSIDQKNKNAYMISIPRDLEVRYGRACMSGMAGKINAFFNCVNEADTEEAEDERQEVSRQFFGEVVGMDIQYTVHVNYTVMRDLVGALGGITVTIESPDPRGQMDGNFDWKCGATQSERIKKCPPRGHFIDYPNGPVDLDAEHALYLAQARGDTPVNWGFPNSNFEREKNQQKILVAIKEKATSLGTLSNPAKVMGIIDALGNNLRTNIETSEIRTLMDVAQNMPSASIKSISLIDEGVVGGNAQPTAGQFNFSEIRALIDKKLSSNPVTQEGANIVVLNGSGVGGIAQAQADKLESAGMLIDSVANAPTQEYKTSVVYVLNSHNPATKADLERRFATTAKTTSPPVSVGEDIDFVVVIGASAQTSD